MKKLILFTVGVVCTVLTLHAQSPSETKPLSIGDAVPDVTFEHLLNYKSPTAKLSDFRGRLVILDFWSTTCGSCIGLFPHMQSLAHEFKNDLQIILVNGKTDAFHDTRSKIQSLLERLRKVSNLDIQLPIVYNCKTLDSYFPYSTIPYEVWISKGGKFIAATDGIEVNEANIRAVIEGKTIKMHTKKDVDFNLDTHSLSYLVFAAYTTVPTPLYSSVLVKGLIDGLSMGIGVRRISDSQNSLYNGWYATNLPLLEIYRSAFRNIMKYPDNRIIIQSKDSAEFHPVNYRDTSMYSHVFSYDITVPPCSFNKLLEYVREDLNNKFQTTVSDERRMVECYVLGRTPRTSKSYTKGGAEAFFLNGIYARKYIRNYPLQAFVNDLNSKYFQTPLVNNTHLKINVDINLPKELTQQSIIQALKNAGFSVTREKKEMEVTVIKDK